MLLNAVLDKNALEKTVFKKPIVFAIFHRLGVDHSLSCCIIFTFLGSIFLKQWKT